jgi:hypothetical protein
MEIQRKFLSAITVKLISLPIVLLMAISPSVADAFLELNAFYTSETGSTASSVSRGRTFLEGTVGFRIDKPGQYLVGWGIASHSVSDSATSSETYSSLQMGPRFLWFMNKEKSWSLGLAYYIVTTGSYSSGGGSSETWKGTALHADLGYNLPLDDSLFFSVRYNYSAATFTERLVDSTTYSTVSYNKTFIYPSLAVFYIF